MMDLTIVIPVWNEAVKIVKDIMNIDEHFKNTNLSCELIIVDDGSSDRTVEISREMLKMAAIQSKVITGRHLGKGHAGGDRQAV